MKFSLLLAITFAAFAQNVKTTHDKELGITWLVPQKPPLVSFRHGIVRTQWRCFPTVFEDAKLGTTGIVLNVEGYGLTRLSANVSFAADGARFDIANVSWITPPALVGGAGLVSKASIRDQAPLIEAIAKATDVWMVTGTPGQETKVKLTPKQIALFAQMVERYKALDPK